MKTAIVFGITGQDGSHLADLLLEKGYTVVGVTRRSSTDNTIRIKHVLDNPSFKLVEGDITDSVSICNIFRNYPQVDEIYNLAAQSHVGTSFKQPNLTWDITGRGCLNILQAIVDLNMQDRVRFYQASSSEMFGSSYTVKDGQKYQDENTPFLPQSPYAVAKVAAHYLVRLYREAYGVHGSCGILFNHEGPRRGENFVTRKITKWIGDFVRWAQENNISKYSDFTFSDEEIFYGTLSYPKLRLGNIEAYRDWGYAGDYVEAMWLMTQQEQADDYVICTGETVKVKDFLQIAFDYIGIPNYNDFIFIDPEFYRPAEVDYLKGCSKKANEKLGWTPKNSFDSLVTMMMKHDLYYRAKL